jgi:hypothetical protein
VLNSYQDRCLDIIKLFDTFNIKHIPQEENSRSNWLAQQASGYVVSQEVFWVASVSLVEHMYELRSKGKLVLQNSDRLQDEEKTILDNMNQLLGKTLPDLQKTEPESGKTEPGSGKAELESGKTELEHGCEIGLREEAKQTLGERFKEELVTKKDEVEKDVSPLEEGKAKPIREGDSVKGGDTIWTNWRLPLLKYTSLDDDLYRRTIDGMLLKCLGEEQAKVVVREVHDGICGAHLSSHKMNWLLRRVGFYWLTMMDDCIKYQRGCEVCQRFGNIQLAPTSVMNLIVKPCPFRGWGLDFIGEIHPRSSKGHRFILVAWIISPSGPRQYH